MKLFANKKYSNYEFCLTWWWSDVLPSIVYEERKDELLVFNHFIPSSSSSKYVKWSNLFVLRPLLIRCTNWLPSTTLLQLRDFPVIRIINALHSSYSDSPPFVLLRETIHVFVFLSISLPLLLYSLSLFLSWMPGAETSPRGKKKEYLPPPPPFLLLSSSSSSSLLIDSLEWDSNNRDS